jgi:hypothetical protein
VSEYAKNDARVQKYLGSVDEADHPDECLGEGGVVCSGGQEPREIGVEHTDL